MQSTSRASGRSHLSLGRLGSAVLPHHATRLCRWAAFHLCSFAQVYAVYLPVYLQHHKSHQSTTPDNTPSHLCFKTTAHPELCQIQLDKPCNTFNITHYTYHTQVDMMARRFGGDAGFRYAAVPGSFRAVRLPYKGSRLAAIVVLPDKARCVDADACVCMLHW